LSESVQQRWLQSDLADGTCKRVRRNLLNPATSARLPDVSRQVVQKAFVERRKAEGDSHQVRVI
jgi:hypothetical protein